MWVRGLTRGTQTHCNKLECQAVRRPAADHFTTLRRCRHTGTPEFATLIAHRTKTLHVSDQMPKHAVGRFNTSNKRLEVCHNPPD